MKRFVEALNAQHFGPFEPATRGEHAMVEVLAWCGAALSCLLSIPQAIRVLRAERLDGISASTYMIVLSNAAIWAAWSLLAREYAAGIPGLVNGPAAILILHRLMVARQKRRIEKPDGSLVGRASRNRHWNLWLPRGLLTRHAAKQSQQHHHPETNHRHAGGQGDHFRSIGTGDECGDRAHYARQHQHEPYPAATGERPKLVAVRHATTKVAASAWPCITGRMQNAAADIGSGLKATPWCAISPDGQDTAGCRSRAESRHTTCVNQRPSCGTRATISGQEQTTCLTQIA
jgi:uncharacterized protein with PQ loop repeat